MCEKDKDDDRVGLDKVRDHAWDYFALHAEQRLKTFHFFIVLETTLIAIMLFAARSTSGPIPLSWLIGILMLVLSFVFWKLDQRTKGMIKVSEAALKLFESKIGSMSGNEDFVSVLPFTNDPQSTGGVGNSPFAVVSYSKCFGAIFLIFAVLGLGVAIFFWHG